MTVSGLRQHAVLDALVGTDLPVPPCVASDNTIPAAVTTWLPGEIDLDPLDPQCWITALADTDGLRNSLDSRRDCLESGWLGL